MATRHERRQKKAEHEYEKEKYQHEMRKKKRFLSSNQQHAALCDHQNTFRFFGETVKRKHEHAHTLRHQNEIHFYSFFLAIELANEKKNSRVNKNDYFENISRCFCCCHSFFLLFFIFKRDIKLLPLFARQALCVQTNKSNQPTKKKKQQTNKLSAVTQKVRQRGVLSQKLKYILNGIGMPARCLAFDLFVKSERMLNVYLCANSSTRCTHGAYKYNHQPNSHTLTMIDVVFVSASDWLSFDFFFNTERSTC